MKKSKLFAVLSFGALSLGFLVGCNKGINYGELHPAKSATCMKTGNIAYYYSAEGKFYNEKKEEIKEADIVTPRIAHSGNKVASEEASCTKDGHVEYYVCSMCSQKFSDNSYTQVLSDDDIVIHATGHEHVTKVDANEATCASSGTKEYYKCDKGDAYWEDEAKTKPIVNIQTWLAMGGGGYVPKSENHQFGDLIPAKAKHRDQDGCLAHYECQVCHNAYLDENLKPVTKEDIIIPNTYDTFEIGEDYAYELATPVSMSEDFVVDFKMDSKTSGENWLKIALIDDEQEGEWADHSTKTITLMWNDIIEEGTVSGVEACALSGDDYIRVIFHLPKMETTGKMENVTILTINKPNTTGSLEVSPVGGEVIRGAAFKAGAWDYFDDGVEHKLDEIITIDLKFTNEGKIVFKLAQDWDKYTGVIEINSDGTLAASREGVVVQKVKEKKGYVGGYYRVTIDLSKATSWPLVPGATEPCIDDHVTRMAVSNWTTASGYVVFNYSGGIEAESMTRYNQPSGEMSLHFFKAITYKDGGEIIPSKGFTFRTSGEGSGTAKFTMMDFAHAWQNLGTINLTFANGELSESKVTAPGKSDIALTYVKGVDGIYTVTVPFASFIGDGVDLGSLIDGFYCGNGICFDGLEAVSLSLTDIYVVTVE